MLISVLDQTFHRDDPNFFKFLESALRKRSLSQGLNWLVDPIDETHIKPQRLFVEFNKSKLEFKVNKIKYDFEASGQGQVRNHWIYCQKEMFQFIEKVKYLLKYYSVEGFLTNMERSNFNEFKTFNTIEYQICNNHKYFGPDLSTPMRD